MQQGNVCAITGLESRLHSLIATSAEISSESRFPRRTLA